MGLCQLDRKEAEMKSSDRIVVRGLFSLIALISLMGYHLSPTGPTGGGELGYPVEIQMILT